MKKVILICLPVLFVACANKATQKDNPLLEKYPQCFHTNVKISNKCIDKNEAGEKTSALEVENTAYPGQYK